MSSLLGRLPFLLCLVLLTACRAAAAETGNWQEGTHYFRIQPAQPTSTPGKVEVLDVFSYGCPACNAFQPTLDKLIAELPPQAQMAYLPAAFNTAEDWPVFQRAFLAAQNLQLAEKSHDAMYDAVWGKNGTLRTTDPVTGHLLPVAQQPTLEEVAKFYGRYGVKPQDFLAVANSFAIQAQIGRVEAQMLADKVSSTPTLIINGKYRLTPSSAGGYAQTLALVKYLIAKEQGG